jgi:ABC-type Fe3+/spermidine/putrescine transport system ATPase subunit
VAVLNAGRVEQIGTVNEIYYKPATRFVASFIGESNIVEAEILRSEGEFLHCRLEGGLELDVRTPKPPAHSQILLSLRPEKIRLTRENPGGRNSFPGTIEMEIFKGAVDDLTISVQGGLQLGAVLTNDGQAESDLHEGECVFARIQPEDIHIVAA